MHSESQKQQETLLAALLVGIALQGLNILTLSALGMLPWCWIGGVLVLLGLGAAKGVLWKNSSPGSWQELTSGWRSPWPSVIGVLLICQIVAYPPTMSDSLCYRLPRLFLALQDGGIGRFPTEDDRINGMPWGWEFLALPFASLNVLNASKWINLAAWAIIYQLLFSFARQHGAPAPRARWIALALATAPVFLLQAASTANDLYAATLILIGVWMIHRFHSAPGPVPVMASLLALVLAANAKPQFLVLGLPWLLWWALAPGKPWKQVPWHILAIAAPIYFLVSPLWILFENHQLTGNLIGSSADTGLTQKPPAWAMTITGTIQFAASQFQLPVLPGAETLTSAFNRLPFIESLRATTPAFDPEFQKLIIVDRASIGLIHSALLIAGLALCLRASSPRCWPWIAAFGFGILISTSQIVPTTIGRSFVGFFSLLLPFAAIGLARWNRPALTQAACIAAIITGAAAMTLNPAAPLWPSKTAQSIAKARGASGLVNTLKTYHSYQKRAQTGIGILDPVPHGETVGVLVRRITPVSTLWQPDWRARRIEFVNHIDPDTFATGTTRWLIVADNAAEFLPQQTARYKNLPGWQPIHQATYLPTLTQGPEAWTLFRKAE